MRGYGLFFVRGVGCWGGFVHTKGVGRARGKWMEGWGVCYGIAGWVTFGGIGGVFGGRLEVASLSTKVNKS